MWEGPYGEWGSRKYMVGQPGSEPEADGPRLCGYFLLSAGPTPPLQWRRLSQALAQWPFRQGKALYVGISNYLMPIRPWRRVGDPGEAGNPLPYPPATSITCSTGGWRMVLLKVLEKKGVGGVPFSPLAQGLFDGPVPERNSGGVENCGGESWFPHRGEPGGRPYGRRIKALNREAELRGQTLAQIALAWILSRKQGHLGSHRCQFGFSAGSQCSHTSQPEIHKGRTGCHRQHPLLTGLNLITDSKSRQVENRLLQ